MLLGCIAISLGHGGIPCMRSFLKRRACTERRLRQVSECLCQPGTLCLVIHSGKGEIRLRRSDDDALRSACGVACGCGCGGGGGCEAGGVADGGVSGGVGGVVAVVRRRELRPQKFHCHCRLRPPEARTLLQPQVVQQLQSSESVRYWSL